MASTVAAASFPWYAPTGDTVASQKQRVKIADRIAEAEKRRIEGGYSKSWRREEDEGSADQGELMCWSLMTLRAATDTTLLLLFAQMEREM